MKSLRFIHYLIATIGGYFWLPCPICGKSFGGHEWQTDKPNSTIMTSWSTGTGVCPKCHDKAKEYNGEWMAANKSFHPDPKKPGR